MRANATAKQLIRASQVLRQELNTLKFIAPVTHVYNPLDYAWAAQEIYLRRYAASLKRVIFIGMNPGPFGMVQTGIPFGEIPAVRDWLKITAPIKKPIQEHPKRPVQGFACPRSEVSGRRLWGLFAARFGTAEKFFAEHYVANYCPLAFFSAAGANLTPDKIGAAQAVPLLDACDRHLATVVSVLKPEWLIGVGDFARKRAETVAALAGGQAKFKSGKILHPSPANPAANRGWAAQATRELEALGVWS